MELYVDIWKKTETEDKKTVSKPSNEVSDGQQEIEES